MQSLAVSPSQGTGQRWVCWALPRVTWKSYNDGQCLVEWPSRGSTPASVEVPCPPSSVWCVCEESKVLDWQLLYFHALDAGADLENKAGVPGVFVVCVVCVRNVCVCVYTISSRCHWGTALGWCSLPGCGPTQPWCSRHGWLGTREKYV